MTESIGHTRKRIKLGYLGFVFGGFVAILPSAGVYYAASLEGRPDALTAGIIFYILMFIGFTALFYMIKVRRIRMEHRKRMIHAGESEDEKLKD